MRFVPNCCPECKAPPESIREVLYGEALLLEPDDDGETDYEGETKVDWNSQTTDCDAEGNVQLTCPNGHVWEAVFADEHDAPELTEAEAHQEATDQA